MATTTTNFGLKKPDYTDSADIGVINEDMDLIDTALKTQQENQEALAEVQEEMSTALGKKVDKVDGSSLLSDEDKESYDAHLKNAENPHGVTAEQVGLGNVDNTADTDKPVSTAQQEALDKKVDKVDGSSLLSDTTKKTYDDHLLDTDNPHEVTKAQVGLGNVDNTADADKPVSTAQQAALDKLEATLQAEIDAGTLGLSVVDGLLYCEYEE